MLVKVKVKASAKKESIEKETKNSYKINVREKAVRNSANERVREVVAGEFGVSKKQVRLIAGHHFPSKTFEVTLKDKP